MKKIGPFIFAAILTLGTLSLHAQDLPAFTDGQAFVFDANAVSGKAKDAIKTKNVSRAKNFQVTVYGFKNDQWDTIATGFLRAPGDSDSLKCKKKIKTYRYFAVTTDPGTDITCHVSKHHDDLYIHFLDSAKPSDSRVDSAQVFDTSKIKGKFKDNIKILAETKLQDPCSFFIYGCKEENGRYELLTCLALKDGFDTDSSDESYTGSKLNSYNYIKILPSPEKEFNYSLSKKHNDLIISIR